MRYWIVILVWAWVGCNDLKKCGLATSRDGVIVKFFEADSVEQAKDSLTFDLVYAENSPFYIFNDQDTLILNPSQALMLPLDPRANRVAYHFETDTVDYQLIMEYQKSLEIFYDECDPMFVYVLDTVYGVNFDSVVMLRPELDSQIPLNVEIYF